MWLVARAHAVRHHNSSTTISWKVLITILYFYIGLGTPSKKLVEIEKFFLLWDHKTILGESQFSRTGTSDRWGAVCGPGHTDNAKTRLFCIIVESDKDECSHAGKSSRTCRSSEQNTSQLHVSNTILKKTKPVKAAWHTSLCLSFVCLAWWEMSLFYFCWGRYFISEPILKCSVMRK